MHALFCHFWFPQFALHTVRRLLLCPFHNPVDHCRQPVSPDLSGVRSLHEVEFCKWATDDKACFESGDSSLAFSIAVVISWALTCPSESDPKNIKYVLWKSGLYGMNLDTPTSTMIGDGSREKLVVGKTKVQLREKFGYLSKPADVSPYLRG